jgi:TRAP transporter TAXI family solute receptor
MCHVVKCGMTAAPSDPAQKKRRLEAFRHKPTLREALIIWLPTLLLVFVAFRLTYHFVQPAPPDHITMTTGAIDGAYHQYALKYRAILARDGITLELKPSGGSVENLARLKDNTANVGFVQGGLGTLGNAPLEIEAGVTQLYSLGNLGYEGVWIFLRGKREITRLTELQNAKLAIGAPGSGSRKVALDLLAAHGLNANNTQLSPLGGGAAIEALQGGQLDAVLLIAAPEAPVVRQAAAQKDLRLMSFANADAIGRRFPYLAPVTLAQGVFDLQANLPAKDVRMVATKANLVIREDLHPALAYLLLEAMMEVHAAPGIFNAAGEFPSPVATDFPLAEEAKRYFKTGRPFLQRYLPFWLANLVERMLVFLVPLFGVVLPIMKFLPIIVNWRRQQRINRWYGELHKLELDLDLREFAPEELAKHMQRMEEIEEAARYMHMPLNFSDKVYTLRQHIDFVRARLAQPPGGSAA